MLIRKITKWFCDEMVPAWLISPVLIDLFYQIIHVNISDITARFYLVFLVLLICLYYLFIIMLLLYYMFYFYLYYFIMIQVDGLKLYRSISTVPLFLRPSSGLPPAFLRPSSGGRGWISAFESVDEAHRGIGVDLPERLVLAPVEEKNNLSSVWSKRGRPWGQIVSNS